MSFSTQLKKLVANDRGYFEKKPKESQEIRMVKHDLMRAICRADDREINDIFLNFIIKNLKTVDDFYDYLKISVSTCNTLLTRIIMRTIKSNPGKPKFNPDRVYWEITQSFFENTIVEFELE